MLRNDPLVRALQAFGYNLVRLPRANLEPSMVLSKDDGDLEVFGTLADILQPGAPLPPITRDIVVANLAGDRAQSGEVALDVGLGFLGTVLTAMGAGSAGLDAAFSRASTVSFEFLDPRQDEIRIADLDRALAGTSARPGTGALGRLFGRGALYVMTATLKCKTLRVEAQAADGQEIGLDASQIQAAVGGKVRVKADAQRSSAIVYEGEVPLVFGFQAVRIRYGLFGQFQGFERVSPGEGALRAPEPGESAAEPRHDPALTVFPLDNATFVNLSDARPDDGPDAIPEP